MCKGDVLMIKFVLLKNHYCQVCKKNILHEYGTELETKKNYCKCISCDTLTEVKNESQRQQDNVTSHYPTQQNQERTEDIQQYRESVPS